MDSETVARGTDRIMDHAVALQDTGEPVQLRKAITASREDTVLCSITDIEALAGCEGRIAEDSDGFNCRDGLAYHPMLCNYECNCEGRQLTVLSISRSQRSRLKDATSERISHNIASLAVT